ncbi:hypothetical protein FNF29_01935 [Cafeteria roenbergensis]|uniref:Uncharacterized protein n=1 Tax=Cafeteria roenbergensis TaxID=33653 RepID=A0A5A8CRU6_CAFRO|nr:hypothetical protein FNF29_01935 [Cafeteria roenbergensis]|eukprot:KAA0155184.1 hypothetical protein FNF29_01935 [Cafeteria roenbergensis]
MADPAAPGGPTEQRPESVDDLLHTLLKQLHDNPEWVAAQPATGVTIHTLADHVRKEREAAAAASAATEGGAAGGEDPAGEASGTGDGAPVEGGDEPAE